MKEKTPIPLPPLDAGMQARSCCAGGSTSSIRDTVDSAVSEPDATRSLVRENYTRVAITDTSRHLGYTETEMNAVPDGGNPTAITALNPGETVVDLGSGGGFDCFLAAAKVGETGRVIGVDMTAEMIDLARANAKKGGYANVEFRLGEIEKLPVADSIADVVISNCVINLSQDKDRVFREAFRVLKPGGRIMVSDIVLLRELPAAVRRSVAAYVGCVAGAVSRDSYLNAVRKAGFSGIRVLKETPMPFELMAADPTVQSIAQDLALSREAGMQLAESILSITVHAGKAHPDR